MKYLVALAVALLAAIGALVWWSPTVRSELKVALGLEPPPAITPLPLGVPVAGGPTRVRPATITASRLPLPSPTAGDATTAVRPSSPSVPTIVTATAAPPTLPPSPTPVERSGRIYDVYIAAAVKQSQAYQYSCEFDAAWVILQTFGIETEVDEIISRTPFDDSVEPYFEETPDGFVIRGGDIFGAYSGNYRKNFLARSTGAVFLPIFQSYGLRAEPVEDREAIEATLRAGGLVWIKTTVDFKPWRPATWITPDGRTHRTVLGNDHAVVVIGFNQEGVVIRDVLGPTSSNRRRPLEYEVDWPTFLAAWGAQSNDGVAVFPS